MAVDNKLIGLIAIADVLRKEAEKVIRNLKKNGKEIIMLTGDSEITAKQIAKQLGIDRYIAEATPNKKIEEIKKLQSEGHLVAMVGDGINDAPSLTQADVGIAMGGGTDISAEAGDVVIIQDDLEKILTLFKLGKKTLNKIKQNLFWAFIYNIILIPIAAGVLYPFLGLVLRPELAGLAMALSSITVTTNALLLKKWKG